MTIAESIREERPLADYFGANADSLAVSGDHFYSGADRRNTLDQLVHFCRFSEQLVVLSAEPGEGKTTLVDATITQLHAVIDCCRVPASDISTTESIASTFGRVLKLPLESPSTKDFLASLQSRTVVDEVSEPLLIIVEQAEQLPLAYIESLVKLHELARTSMHLMLVGTSPLKRRVEKIAAHNPHIKIFTLPPLSLVELGSYVLSRMQSAGYGGNQPLSQDQLIVLHEQSAGNMAQVNRLMPLLLDNNLTRTTAVTRQLLPVTHLLALISLVGVLAAAIFLEYGSSEPVTDTLSLDQRIEREETVMAKRTSRELAIPLAVNKVDRAVTVIDRTPVSTPAPAVPAVEVINPPQLTAEPAKPVPSQAKKPPVPEVAIEKPDVAKAPVLIPAKQLSAREQSFMALAPSGYMLQILGSSNEDGVRDYVKRYAGRFSISYFETEMRQKPWYVVLVGPYAGRDEARQSIQALPAEVQKQKPWVRSVSSIQSEIKARN